MLALLASQRVRLPPGVESPSAYLVAKGAFLELFTNATNINEDGFPQGSRFINNLTE